MRVCQEILAEDEGIDVGLRCKAGCSPADGRCHPAVQVHYGIAKGGATKLLLIAFPYLGLLMIYFLVQAWQAAKALDQELSTELESVVFRSSEVFAELILAWLNEGLDTKTKFTLEQVAKQTGLRESSALQGLTLLENKYGIVRETLLSRAWEYSAVGPAVRLRSRYRLNPGME